RRSQQQVQFGLRCAARDTDSRDRPLTGSNPLKRFSRQRALAAPWNAAYPQRSGGRSVEVFLNDPDLIVAVEEPPARRGSWLVLPKYSRNQFGCVSAPCLQERTQPEGHGSLV